MNFVFLMDPLETVVMEKDTSFIFMLGAHRKGHKIFYLSNEGLMHKNGALIFNVLEVVPQAVSQQPFIKKDKHTLLEKDVDIIFVRNDPPFDEQYLLNTWLLDLVAQRIPIINRPFGVRTVNEKLWAAQFTFLIPRTYIGRDKEKMLEFINEEKNVVAKPTNGHGGQSIFRIKQGDLNTNVILETLTNKWKRSIILQQFVPESAQGDKRILLLNGEPLKAVLRVHAADDHRNNFFAGGKAVATDITPRDKEIIETLKPHLKQLGLYFVGIDIMGPFLIEVNVTSPTCLQEMNRLYNLQLEDTVIEFAQKQVDEFRSINKMRI